MSDYPNYDKWLALLDKRDQGVFLVVVVAIIVALLLWNFRSYLPDALPKLCSVLVILYYATLLATLLVAFVFRG